MVYASSIFDCRRKREALPQNGLALHVLFEIGVPSQTWTGNLQDENLLS